jgi:L-iditol 2-dehydrogenase
VIATDIDEARLRAAARFGADLALNAKENIPTRLKEVNEGRLADSIIVCTGAVSALQQAMESVERGGTILFFAPTDKGVTIPLSINDFFWRNDVTLTTSYAGDYADHMTALQLIQAKRVTVKEMITHKLGLAETVEGFKLVAEAHDSIKVIIEPQK